jgi:hypothetical protein
MTWGFSSKCVAAVAGNTMQDGGLMVMNDREQLSQSHSIPTVSCHCGKFNSNKTMCVISLPRIDKPHQRKICFCCSFVCFIFELNT